MSGKNRSLDYIRKNVFTIQDFISFSEILNEGIAISNLKTNTLFSKLMDVILVHGVDFYNHIQNSDKLDRSIIESMWKYIIRGTGNPTPLCFFSGVSTIELKNRTRSNYFDIDYRWFIEFYSKYLGNEHLINLKHLYYKNNESSYVGDIYSYIYTEERKNVTLVDNNETLEMLLKYLNKPREFYEIKIFIHENMSNEITDDQLFNILENLLSKKILVSSVDYKTSSPLLYKYLEDILKYYQYPSEHKNKLIKLFAYFKEINESYSSETYLNIIKIMKKIFVSKYYIYVIKLDSFNSIDNIEYFYKNTDGLVEDFSSVLNEMTGFLPKQKVIDSVLEKYGQNVLIPFKSLFDEFKNNDIKTSPSPEILREVEGVLHKIVTNAKVTNNNKVDLKKEEFISKLNSALDVTPKVSTECHNDCDLLFDISMADNNIKKIKLADLIGTSRSGSLSGRFGEVLGIESQMKSEASNKLGNKAMETMSISSSFKDSSAYNVLPRSTKTSRVLYLNRYQIEETKEIKLDDLHLFVDYYNNLNLYSIEENKILNLRNNTALNPLIANEIYSFLILLTEQDSLIEFLSYIIEYFNNIDCQLEVYYGDICIYMPRTKIYYDKNLTEDFYIKFIKDYLPRKLNLNSTIVTCKSENRTWMLDITNKYHIQFFIKQLKKEGIVTFEKNIFAYEKHNTNTSQISCQISTSYFNNNEFCLKTNNSLIEKKDLFPLISRCSYLKVYVNSIYTRELYIKLKNFLSDSIYKEYITGISIVRYIDSKYHLRIRLFHTKLDSVNILQELIFYLKKIKYINDIAIDTYTPELNRYGHNNIEKFEEYTVKETNLIMDIFSLKKFTSEQIKILASYMKLMIFQKFNLEENLINYSVESKVSRIIKSRYHGRVSDIIKEIMYIDYMLNDFLNESFSEWKDNLSEFVKSIDNLSEDKFEIYRSVTHMLSNRMLGLDKELELESDVITYLVYHYIKHNPSKIIQL